MADKITSPDQLLARAQKAQADLDLRQGRKDTQVTVHMGTCGIAAGARETMQAVLGELKRREIDAQVTTVGCIGMCAYEPLVDIEQAEGTRITYGPVKPDMVPRLIEEHLINGRVVQEWVVGRMGKA